MKRALASLALSMLAPATAGCVAAIVPLYAGAALLKAGPADDSPSVEPVGTAQASPPVAAATPAPSEGAIVATALTRLPTPDGAAALRPNPAVAAFRSYAMTQASLGAGVGSGKRFSAIVPDASALRPARGLCAAGPTAVFVDLDPGRGTFDPLSPGVADGALAEALAALREKGVTVVWFSRLGASFADAARASVMRSGLDPAGEDELVLMQDLEERKQTRRDTVAKRVCPIAIVGDERADFDELYLYLKDPDAALPLDSMIGRGWFLASPFAQSPSEAAGATP